MRRPEALLRRTRPSANRVDSEHSCPTAEFGSKAPRWGQSMAKVFLSYDRDDTERARPIALALEKAGHSVWWDLHIRGGEQYTKVIDEALKAADAVVVLWSRFSVESAWVRDEAAAGRDSGRLVPVALDRTAPPLGFRQFQTIDISNWKGRGKPLHLAELLASIETVAGPATDATPLSRTTIEPPERAIRFPKWSVYLIASITVLVLGRLVVPGETQFLRRLHSCRNCDGQFSWSAGPRLARQSRPTPFGTVRVLAAGWG